VPDARLLISDEIGDEIRRSCATPANKYMMFRWGQYKNQILLVSTKDLVVKYKGILNNESMAFLVQYENKIQSD
jgi:hypothetical protein